MYKLITWSGLGNSIMLNSTFQKVTVRLRPLLMWCCFLCQWVVSTYIWPIGRGIPWGNHGCLPVVTSWHTLQLDLYYIWSVGVSLTQRNYAWALALLSSHRYLGRGVWTWDRCIGIQILKGSGPLARTMPSKPCVSGENRDGAIKKGCLNIKMFCKSNKCLNIPSFAAWHMDVVIKLK